MPYPVSSFRAVSVNLVSPVCLVPSSARQTFP